MSSPQELLDSISEMNNKEYSHGSLTIKTVNNSEMCNFIPWHAEISNGRTAKYVSSRKFDFKQKRKPSRKKEDITPDFSILHVTESESGNTVRVISEENNNNAPFINTNIESEQNEEGNDNDEEEATNQGKRSLIIGASSSNSKRRRRNIVNEEDESNVNLNNMKQRENSTEESNSTENEEEGVHCRATRSKLRNVDGVTREKMREVQDRSLSYQFQFFASLGKEKGKKK